MKCETSNLEHKNVIGDGPAVARWKLPREGLQRWEQRSDHAKFRDKITTSPVEEERLGIPDLVGCSVMRHLNYDAACMDRLPTIHDLHLDELVIHNRSTTWRLCRLHCLLMFIIILTSSHKLMFFVE